MEDERDIYIYEEEGGRARTGDGWGRGASESCMDMDEPCALCGCTKMRWAGVGPTKVGDAERAQCVLGVWVRPVCDGGVGGVW